MCLANVTEFLLVSFKYGTSVTKLNVQLYPYIVICQALIVMSRQRIYLLAALLHPPTLLNYSRASLLERNRYSQRLAV